MRARTLYATSTARYGVVAMSLHWIIAALILANIGIAWYFNTLHGDAKVTPVQWHKSIGITVLILSVLRLAWRLVNPPPPLPPRFRGWQRVLAETVHAGFYVIMLGMPLSGWIFSSASPLIRIFPITLYGVAPWPTITPLANLPPDQMKQVHHVFVAVHEWLAKGAYALIVLHVAGALKHQFVDHDSLPGRMIPFLGRRAQGALP
jgi:cytochrome b561